MDFTREPIIETVITPKEGCKLVVRSSKSSGQEEYFVDAVEVVSFGSSFFFRSLERPKSFLVPTTDYEILEVREARMVLKNVGLDRSIKIGGGREASVKPAREAVGEKAEALPSGEELPAAAAADAVISADGKPERLDKKRDRRRHYRRRRGRDEPLAKEEGTAEGTEEESISGEAMERIDLPVPRKIEEEEDISSGESFTATSVLTSLLPPPPTLISETIARYKDNALFKGAFFLKDDKEKEEEPVESSFAEVEQEEASPPFQTPGYGSFEMTEKEEEDAYRQRTLLKSLQAEPIETGFPIEPELEQGPETEESERSNNKIPNED